MLDLDPLQDPLHLLITYCPLVEDFCFSRTNYIFQAEWQYLRSVLEQRRHDWHLINLATYFDRQDYDQYYNCALIMKNSLKQFYLKQKQLDYGIHFKEFSQLTKLIISRRVIDNVVDLDSIVCHLPLLTYVDTEFYIPKTSQPNNRVPNNIQYSQQPFTNIKELQSKNFPLSKDLDLLFIMQKFINLDIIKIAVGRGNPWPISRITPNVLQEFFRFICKSRICSVVFTDIDVIRALHLYFLSLDHNDGNFQVSFTNILDKGENTTSFHISSEECVKIVYNLVGNSSNGRIIKAKQMLTGIQNYIRHLRVSLLGKHSIAKKIEEFLPLIFESCKELTKLTVCDGKLTGAMSNKLKKQSNIKELTFNKACIDLVQLPVIMNLFPYLDMFQLDNCQFLGDESTHSVTAIQLNMFETRFDTIKVSFKDIGMPGIPKNKTDELGIPVVPIKQNKVFITVNLAEDQMTKYYCGDVSVSNVMIVTRAAYYEHLEEARITEHILDLYNSDKIDVDIKQDLLDEMHPVS
ncbi:hypothetical protein INT48_008073 [Thamnidium elegans]|uniref:Uncharacterized protein n=1 Tax=Thamnidium elegans TaxID=101142 RepID=A0A8H7SFB9_9FUNG|nr:hypothetical protein INT48_008073 [Thamnidium elegans]